MELTDVLDGPCCKIRCITRGVGNGTPLPKFLQKQGATGVVAARLRSKAVGRPDRQSLPKEWRTVLLHMEMLVKEGFEIATGGRVKLFTGKFSGIGELKVITRRDMAKVTEGLVRVAPWLAEDYAAAQLDPDYMAEKIVMGIKVQLRKAMDREEVSQSRLADRLGWTRGAVSRLFGVSNNISIARLARVASALGRVITVPEIVRPEDTFMVMAGATPSSVSVRAERSTGEYVESFEDSTTVSKNVSVE